MSETSKRSPESKPMVGPQGEIKYETIKQYQVFLWRLTVGVAGLASVLALGVGSWTVNQVVCAHKEINELKLSTAATIGEIDKRVALIEVNRFSDSDGYALKEELRREMRQFRSAVPPPYNPRSGP